MKSRKCMLPGLAKYKKSPFNKGEFKIGKKFMPEKPKFKSTYSIGGDSGSQSGTPGDKVVLGFFLGGTWSFFIFYFIKEILIF